MYFTIHILICITAKLFFHKLLFTHFIIFFLLEFTYTIHIIITILFMYFQILFSSHFLSCCPIINII
ncbi:hypothetical protein WR51_15015 [Bacillus cereus]|nr:hypothetical protein WR47_15015 [Bacillus cereus]ANC14174.1 hypothetical protein WR51_15015 [Bacillus cereus]